MGEPKACKMNPHREYTVHGRRGLLREPKARKVDHRRKLRRLLPNRRIRRIYSVQRRRTQRRRGLQPEACMDRRNLRLLPICYTMKCRLLREPKVEHGIRKKTRVPLCWKDSWRYPLKP